MVAVVVVGENEASAGRQASARERASMTKTSEAMTPHPKLPRASPTHPRHEQSSRNSSRYLGGGEGGRGMGAGRRYCFVHKNDTPLARTRTCSLVPPSSRSLHPSRNLHTSPWGPALARTTDALSVLPSAETGTFGSGRCLGPGSTYDKTSRSRRSRHLRTPQPAR